ncbi:MAG TPA: class I SAM-dependent methyltransferase [Candidatus Kapabacteria bacterium]|nr:class I SAM-dependent methyltransferase [Candidatus Kapabacteria bacterium]
MKYDRSHTEAFYDALGEREWERFERNAATRVSLATHLHYLRQYIHAGDSVLDIGAGPGRFTIELAKLGANIIVGDISKAQLELNARKVSEAGFESSVHERVQCDIVNLSMFADSSFDAVVAYGGPISYALDRANDAIGEMLRVTKAGGHVLLSVMSRLGALRHFFPQVLELVDSVGLLALTDPWESGILDERFSAGHRLRLFLSSELLEMLGKHSCKILAMSASNYLAYAGEQVLENRWDDAEFWNRFLEIELETCREPGALDGGTHLIAVLEKV